MAMRLGKVNSLIVMGRVCADVELKYTPSGTAVLGFRVAVDDSYFDKNKDDWVKRDYFFSVTAWAKAAEALSKRLVKGSAVIVEGKLTSRSWEAKDGTKRYAVEITASRVQCLDKREQSGAEPTGDHKQQDEPESGDGGGGGLDDIPFVP